MRAAWRIYFSFVSSELSSTSLTYAQFRRTLVTFPYRRLGVQNDALTSMT